MIGSLLGGASGGGYSASASSGATSGGNTIAPDSAFGDFNFKTASGASSVGGVSPLLIGGAVLAVALVAWIALRKR